MIGWILLIGLALTTSAEAGLKRKPLVVAQDGSGQFRKIQEAVDASRPGDQILIKAGDYYESVVVQDKTDLSMTGQGIVWVKAEGDNEILSIRNSTRIAIANIKGIHISEAGCYNNVFGITDSRGVGIYKCVANGSGIFGFDITNSNGVILSENQITRCTMVGASISESSNISVVRNVFSENGDWRTINVSNSQHVYFKNNTVVRNVGVPLVLSACIDVQFYNNIVANNRHSDNSYGVLNATGSSTELNFQYNVVFNNESPRGTAHVFDMMGTETVTADAREVDPGFVNISSGNFGLRANSPCLKTGYDHEDIGAVSAAGNAKDAGNWLSLAEQAFAVRDFDQVLFFNQAILERTPNDLSAHVGAGNGYLGLGYYQEAASHYQQALNLDPNNSVTMYNFACLYALQNDPGTALAWLERAFLAGMKDRTLVDTDPDLANLRADERFQDLVSRYLGGSGGSGGSRFDDAVKLYSEGNVAGAESAFREVLNGNPNHAEALFYLGLICEQRQDFPTALSYYQSATQANPRLSNAHLAAGNVYYAFQNYTAAAESYKRVLEIDPNNVTAYSNLGAVYAVQKDISTAEHYLQLGYQVQPNDPSLCYNLACLYSLQHRMEDALNFLQRAFENGYRDVQHIQMDSDLDAIRDHPRFHDLLRQYGGQ